MECAAFVEFLQFLGINVTINNNNNNNKNFSEVNKIGIEKKRKKAGKKEVSVDEDYVEESEEDDSFFC